MALIKSLALLQALLLSFEHVVAKPIPLITRQTIEDEYDFVICGGWCHTTILSLSFTIQCLILIRNSHQVERPGSSSPID